MLVCIWCEDKNRGIGKDNKLPWKNDIEMLSFKTLTSNNIIVMGYKTFKSLNFKPLPNRINYVISDKDINIDKSKYPNLYIINNNVDINNLGNIVFCIGGKFTYKQYIPQSDFLLVSKLHNTYNCDLFMDNDYENFNIETIINYHDFDIYIYKNKKSNIKTKAEQLFNFYHK